VAENGSRNRRATSTSSFGVGKRENHDSSEFYKRFTPPEISKSEDVHFPPVRKDEIWHGRAQDLLADDTLVAANSVALVVTSPPYFVGKEYEQAMGEGHVPTDYAEHLESLHEVFARCVEKLEPGGRIAVNVANLGRRPYRSQAADIVRIFEDLGLLLRGEIIWQKSAGLSGSTAWGSFQSAANPVLRDMTERIIVASKGRFDRAVSRRVRAERDWPSVSSLSREAFVSYTTDVWSIPTESASRVGHPAPFPVALPRRLIELYTYEQDLVLDPYVGSGTTAIAAMRTHRKFVGCDTDPDFVENARLRIADEGERLRVTKERRNRLRVAVPAVRSEPDDDDAAPLSRAVREGRKAEYLAELVLDQCGFTVTGRNKKLSTGIEIDFVATARDGSVWHFDVTGAFTSERGGLRRTDTLWKSLGKAAMRTLVEDDRSGHRFVLLTTDLPTSGVGLKAVHAARGQLILDAIEMLSEDGQRRLSEYADAGEEATEPIGELLVEQDQDALF